MEIHQPVKAIVVDDEKPSREVLINYITEYCPEIEIVDECNSVRTAYRAILENNPQLVFLDIEMPRGSGFDLLGKFEKIDFRIIFVTAYSRYAIRAFRFAATDYLLKPVKVSELKEAVDRVIQDLKLRDSYENIITLTENLASPAQVPKNLVIPDLKGFSVLKISEIIMCEADGYCTNFYSNGRNRISSSRNLKFYEELLCEDHQFMRIHHSYIINLHEVISYSHQGEVQLSGNLKCPLSAPYKQFFLNCFKKTK